MTDTIEIVVDLIYPAINGPREAAVAIARQAITAHTKALIEGAGELCTALKFHGRYGSENRDQMTVRKNGEREQAAATIAAQRAEIERLTAFIQSERDDAAKSGLVSEVRRFEAVLHGCAAALSDLIAGDADLIDGGK